MDDRAIMQAIRDRCVADTGLTALVPAASIDVEMGAPDQGAKFPSIVIAHVSTTRNPDEGFRFDSSIVEWRFSIFGTLAGGLDTLYQVRNRLYGNATQLATRVPAFGFHRHRLVLPTATATGFACDECEYVQSLRAHDEDIYTLIEQYSVRVQRTAPTS